jgi:hypothetical protein
MIKKFIRFIKNDYMSVSDTIHYMFKFKVPELAILIWYILVAPIGFMLRPFVKIYFKVLTWNLDRKYGIKN